MEEQDINTLTEEWAGRLRARGMRRTRSLDLLIRALLECQRPVTIAELSAAGNLADVCDPATVYRLLMKLEEHGMVRRLGLHERSIYFIPVLPGQHRDYLICTGCGSIQEAAMACPGRALEAELENNSGYRHVYHELVFYGICPACHGVREHDGRTHCCHVDHACPA